MFRKNILLHYRQNVFTVSMKWLRGDPELYQPQSAGTWMDTRVRAIATECPHVELWCVECFFSPESLCLNFTWCVKTQSL